MSHHIVLALLISCPNTTYYFIRLLTKLSQTVYRMTITTYAVVSHATPEQNQTRLANKLGNGTDCQITVNGRYSIDGPPISCLLLT